MAEDLEMDAIEAFANIGDSASLTSDALGKINEIKYDSFGEAIKGIGRNFQTGLFLPLGEMILPILNEFAQWINDKMPVLQGVFESVFEKIETVATAVHTFFKDNILPIFSELFNNVQENFPIIQETAQTVFNGILEVATAVWEFIKDNILPIFVSMYEWIQGHMPTIRRTFETVFGKITDVAKMVWNFFKDNILPIFERLFSWVQSKIPSIQSIFEKAFGVIKNVVEIVWDIFENFLLPVLKALWDWISPHIPKVQKIVEDAFDAIFWAVDKVVGVFEAVTDAVKKAIDWLGSWNNTDAKDKNINVNTNYTSSGNSGNIPQYAVGTPYVPNDQLAIVHKGEAIIPAKYNPFNSSNKRESIKSEGDQNITMHNSITFNVDGSMTKSDMDNAAKYMFKKIGNGVRKTGGRW